MHSSAIVARVPALVVLLAAACAHSQPRAPASSEPASPTNAAGGRDSVQVGYGTQARRSVTGAVSSIDGDARRGTTTSMADLLEGRVAGLEVRRLGNGAVSVRIRGQRSLLGDGEPLYVVDGQTMSGSSALLADLDPRDVKSIEVLKDAGTLAAYGSRGANGVILIRTTRASR